ncbi:TonB-dependent receptor [Sedimentitalea sp. JM2-8]|uniref:TonB-dependent receptor n=1 Tax=Sedimentitalea xiamensis TaxID=3050037 RepID=A0ABT7FI83_9RHOB|nr:TonB-dependent receptor [Sedimentitalea xiamensis]MDK3074705.1 TonB-dependent receptor [Sedimentitalea xiamensis]
MTRSIHLATVAAATLCAQPAISQTPFELDEIVVSGGFTPIEEQRYGRSATVLTAEDIENGGFITVKEALRTVPGVSVSGTGDNLTQVRIRGAEANHTLILIDGVQASAGDNEYVLSGLETANIERIEVLRGPQSVFYGSNASAGVINIITKKGNLGTEFGGTVEAGDGYAATARYSFRTDRGGLALGLSRLDDDGYDYSGSNGEDDGIRRSTINLTGDYNVTEQITLGFTLRASDEDSDFDETNFLAMDPADYVIDDPDQTSERQERQGSLYAEFDALDGRLIQRLTFEGSDFETSTNGGDPTKADRKAAKYLLSYGLDGQMVSDTDHLLNVLLEWEEDSSSTNSEYRRETNSVAMEYRGALENGLNLQGGLRYDDNKTFEDDVVWTLAASYTFAQSGVRLHTSAGTGSVNPSYFELFADSFGFVGNPNLKPEKNESFDIGVDVPFWGDRGSIGLTYFYDNLTDEITAVFDPVSGNSTFINEDGKSNRRGVELSGSLQATDSLNLQLDYTYLRARNPDGSIEIRRPKHELSLSATQEFLAGRGQVTADLRYVAGNYDTQFFGNFDTKELPDYVTVDLSAQYELTDAVQLTGRIVNLFDETYSDTWGYATRGRTAYVGLRAAF